LQEFPEVSEVAVVVYPQKQLSEIRRTLVVVAEVRQQLEDAAALLLEVALYPKKLVSKCAILHVFFLHFTK